MNGPLARVALSFALAISLAAAPAAQQAHEIGNPGLEEGTVGEAPPGWHFVGDGSTVSLDPEAPFEGSQAACLDARDARGRAFTNLMQSLDATPWRGKRVRYRAAVKTADLLAGATAQLWFRVDGKSDEAGQAPATAFDNMGDRPIRKAEWEHYDIVLDVAPDAERLVFGMFVLGKGRAWIDDVTLEAVDTAVASTGDAAATTRPTLPPAVANAMSEAHLAPEQPFWTWWLLLPAIAITLFVAGMWPCRRAPVTEATAGAPGELGWLSWFALRFTVAYWLLYALPGPVDALLRHVPAFGPALAGQLGTWRSSLESWLAQRTAAWCFGIEGDLVPPNGSGDTTQGYMTILDGFVLALLAATAWMLLGRRLPSRDATVDLLRSYLRYLLALAMLGYGLAKVSVEFNQFPVVDGWRLDRTWGETSPMGVVWAFMGSSRPYTVFGGLAEVLGAVLLLWRHTAVIGAVVTAAVMTNVVLLNFCYDVPVKIYSTHLLLMSVLILVPDLRRIADALVFRRTTLDPGTPSLWSGPSARRVRWLLKGLVLVAGFGLPIWRSGTTLFEHWLTEQPAAAESATEDPHLLTSRGYRWINEVPFNR